MKTTTSVKSTLTSKPETTKATPSSQDPTKPISNGSPAKAPSTVSKLTKPVTNELIEKSEKPHKEPERTRSSKSEVTKKGDTPSQEARSSKPVSNGTPSSRGPSTPNPKLSSSRTNLNELDEKIEKVDKSERTISKDHLKTPPLVKVCLVLLNPYSELLSLCFISHNFF